MVNLRIAIVAFVVLASAVTLAAAAPVVVSDGAGRPFVVDAQVSGVDVAPYAAVLSGAIHGDEIRDLTVRIVPAASIRRVCRDARAAACYSRLPNGDGVITMPPTLTRRHRANLLHEYGHHIDAAYGNGGRTDPNGTPRWWRARGMARLEARGLVAHSYHRGWSRSIGEIFAEDYMVLNGGGRSGITWLRPPSPAVRSALRADIERYPGPSAAWPSSPDAWRGFTAGPIGQGRSVTMQVPVAGVRQRVSAAVRADAPRGVVALTVTVQCDGDAPFTRAAPRGQGLDLQLGPLSGTTCTATVHATDDAPGGASLQVTVGPA